MERKDKSIELRSEKVRNIIGQVPPVLIRSGTLIICVVLVVLFIISIFVPYRETIPAQIEIETFPQAHLIHAPASGFFVSDSISKTINMGSVIGRILCEDSTQKIISPAEGNILMDAKSWDYVNEEELLSVIIPENHIRYGVAKITTGDFCKVREGSRIIMFLSEGKTVSGIVEKMYSFPDTQHNHKVKIKFEGNISQDKLVVGSIYNGKIILNDVSMLKKFASSVGMKN